MTVSISEKQFQAQVIELATAYRWRSYHTYDSRRSAPGFPDLVLAKNGRVIFAELKSEKGRVTPAQKEWLLETSGICGHCESARSYLWRPSDWDDIVDILSS